MTLLPSNTLEEKPEDIKEGFICLFNKQTKQTLSTYSTDEKSVFLSLDGMPFKTHTHTQN